MVTVTHMDETPDLAEILDIIAREADRRSEVILGGDWSLSIKSTRLREVTSTAEVIAAGIREAIKAKR